MTGWKAWNLAFQLSWTLLVSLLLPLLGGILLDKRMSTSPLFVLIGAAVGILAATVGVGRMVIRTFQETEHKHTDAPESRANGEDEPD